MVYCGKPSKGCGQCRSRKIRCDQTRPACSQCTRTKRECPGYRDQLSLMFRDESQSVMRKAEGDRSTSPAQKSSPRSASSGSPRTAFPEQTMRYSGSTDPLLQFNSDAQSQFLMRQPAQTPLVIEPSTGLSKDEAICYFLQSHAIPGSFLMADSAVKFLTKPGVSLSQQARQSTVVAVASAMLSRIRKVASLRQIARQEYGVALQLVNKVLANQEEAKTNLALGVVVLLALYEIVTSRAPQSIEGWTNHIVGAAALLEHRGDKGTETGLGLFLHLRYQIIISCLQRDVWVPESLMEGTKLEIFLQPKDAVGNKLIMIIATLSNLRADVHAKILTDSLEILNAACAIEGNLIAWSTDLPPEYAYFNDKMTSQNLAFNYHCRGISPYNNEYDIYSSLWSPSCWNHYRSARILVGEMILSHVHKLSKTAAMTSFSTEFLLHVGSLRSTISQLAVDICRSVPFHLGACNSHIRPGMARLPHESYLGGLMLLWPLFMAGIVEVPTHPVRRWVMHCLNMIGNVMGLDQALALMDLLAVDPGMFSSTEIYGEMADAASGLPGMLSISIFHVPYYKLPARKEYREIRASLAQSYEYPRGNKQN